MASNRTLGRNCNSEPSSSRRRLGAWKAPSVFLALFSSSSLALAIAVSVVYREEAPPVVGAASSASNGNFSFEQQPLRAARRAKQ